MRQRDNKRENERETMKEQERKKRGNYLNQEACKNFRWTV